MNVENAPQTPADPARDFWETLAVRMTYVAGIFLAAIVVLMLFDYAGRLRKDPSETVEFGALKQHLVELKSREQTPEVQGEIAVALEQIRAADLALRQEYFRQRRFAATGGVLLAVAAAVLLVSAKTVLTINRRLPMPDAAAAPQNRELRTAAESRFAVAGLGAVIVLAGVALGLRSQSTLTVEPKAPEIAVTSVTSVDDGQKDAPKTAEVEPPKIAPTAGETPQPTAGKKPQPTAKPAAPVAPGDLPAAEEIAKNWPRFRGPQGSGISAFDNIPTKWNVESGENIAWKTAVPLEGNSSPIVWNDRIFLTGATAEKREVYCFDAAAGKLLWQKDVPGTPESQAEMEIMEDTGFAAPTPATDGRRVYAIFANCDIAAFDLEGNPVWSRSLGIPKNSYGHATSLVTWRNLLLVQIDQGSPKDGKSKLMALDGASGQTVWQTPRPLPSSWPTPIVIDAGGQEQIITGSDPWIIAYRPADGSEIWRAKLLRQDVGPSPVYVDGILYFANAYPQLSAINPKGEGDLTASKEHVLWIGEDGLPDTCSPLATPQFVLLHQSSGTMTAYEAKKGKKLWEQDFESGFQASPALAGKHVYLFGSEDEGKVWVIEPGLEGCKIVAETAMNEKVTASPAFQDGRMFVRTKTQLYCIGKK